MTPKDNENPNQPEQSHRDGGGQSPERRWAPPGRKPPPRRAGPLTVGEHIARLTKIECMTSKVYSGYTVVTDWETLTGLAGRLFLNFDDNENRQWIIDRNTDHVDAILAAGSMPGCMNPNWRVLASNLKDTWFSIEIKGGGKGSLFLAKLGVPDEDEDPSGSTSEEEPGPETVSEPEDCSSDEPGPAHAQSQVAEQPKFTVEEIRERARANRKANRQLYDADAADDDKELTSND